MKVISRSIFAIFLKLIVLFLTISFVFAFFYLSLDKSFFHANPLQDPAYYNIRENILSDICNSFDKSLKPIQNKDICLLHFDNSSTFPANTIEGVDLGQLKVATIRIGDVKNNELHIFIHNHIQFDKNRVKGMGSSGGSGDDLIINLDEVGQFGPETSFRIADSDSLFKMMPPLTNAYISSYTEFFIDLKINGYDKLKKHSNQLGSFIVFPVKSEQFFELKEYLKNVPNKEPSFLKMLYFSCLTLASFGFGDIIPIGYAARVLVVTEVITGILLFGFFISLLFDEFKIVRDEYERKNGNKQRLTSIFKIWDNYFQLFLYYRKMITEPLEKESSQLEQLKFSSMKNIFFKGGLHTLRPFQSFAYKEYFRSLKLINNFLKSTITTIDYDLNSELIETMTDIVALIEKYDFENSLDGRTTLKLKDKPWYESDMDMFFKDPEVKAEYKDSNSINLYVGIWENMIEVSKKIEHLNIQVNEIKKT